MKCLGERKSCMYVLSLWQQYLDIYRYMTNNVPLWFAIHLFNFLFFTSEHKSKEDLGAWQRILSPKPENIFKNERRWHQQPLGDKSRDFQLEALGAAAQKRRRARKKYAGRCDLFSGWPPAAADACSSLETIDKKKAGTQKQTLWGHRPIVFLMLHKGTRIYICNLCCKW